MQPVADVFSVPFPERFVGSENQFFLPMRKYCKEKNINDHFAEKNLPGCYMWLAPSQSGCSGSSDATSLELVQTGEILQVSRSRSFHPAEYLLDSFGFVEREAWRTRRIRGALVNHNLLRFS